MSYKSFKMYEKVKSQFTKYHRGACDTPVSVTWFIIFFI